VGKAAVILFITGVLDRTRIKYGERGYRYVLIETGHLGQNIALLATELGLGSCALGGFIDSEVNVLLDINLQKEFVLYLIAVGNI
jgi:SagB-type dehydrogenase family enzyme